MSAQIIRFWEGAHADRIRITGPGEDTLNATILILPVVRIERHPEEPARRKGRKPA